MINIYHKEDCMGCSACASVCPKQCISMRSDKEGFVYPTVEKTSCVDCRLCERICPILNKKEVAQRGVDVYAAYNKDQATRLSSSSGGLFSILATILIQCNGLVFGAMVNEQRAVVHYAIERLEDMDALRGSKYVQSDINGTYVQVKHALELDRLVLFSGTPCQVAGLKSFLGKEYEGLITQDFICHGVSSPMVWEKYVQHQETKRKAKIVKASFRSKVKGWSKFSMELLFSNQKTYSKTLDKDMMLQFFLKNYSLRPACYTCQFKGKTHVSDFTLADFWGIEALKPEMDDGKGASIIFVNTEKAERLFDRIKGEMVVERMEMDAILPYNTAILHAVDAPQDRQAFFADMETQNIKKVYKKYCLDPLPKRVIDKIHITLYKLKQKIKRGKANEFIHK